MKTRPLSSVSTLDQMAAVQQALDAAGLSGAEPEFMPLAKIVVWGLMNGHHREACCACRRMIELATQQKVATIAA